MGIAGEWRALWGLAGALAPFIGEGVNSAGDGAMASEASRRLIKNQAT